MLRFLKSIAVTLVIFPVLPLAAQDTPLPDMAAIEQAYASGDFVTARQGLERLAGETGSALAQYRYGRILLEGRGGPRDVGAAARWLQKAVDQNHLEAATLLARLLLSATPRQPEAAARLLSRAATRGDREAQYYLALLIRSGDGLPADPDAALDWLLASAEQGYSPAQYALAEAYSQGKGAEKNPEEALRWLNEAALAGHAEAQFFLARAYETGQGVAANPAEARRFYAAAAENGLVIAARVLGTLYLTGQADAPPNPTEARRWLEAAAGADDAGAMVNLGIALADGSVLAQDDAEAILWLRRAVQRDVPQAQTALARLTEAGRGTDADLDAAIALYRKAAEVGDSAAAVRLGELAVDGALDGKLAPSRAVPWVLAALQAGTDGAEAWLSGQAETGMRAAQSEYGQWLLSQDGRSAEATGWLARAAEAGDRASQALLGQAHVTGEHGLALDYVAAHAWLNLAAANGDAPSLETRDLIAELMTPEQIAEAQARARGYYDAQRALVPNTVQTVTRP